MLVPQPCRHCIHDDMFTIRMPIGMITAPTKRCFLVPFFTGQTLNDVSTVSIQGEKRSMPSFPFKQTPEYLHNPGPLTIDLGMKGIENTIFIKILVLCSGMGIKFIHTHQKTASIRFQLRNPYAFLIHLGFPELQRNSSGWIG